MTFASPWLLLLLPAAGALLLARVLLRPRRPRLAVASLAPLREAAAPSWRLRLRWLPWLLRAAAIALLILAAARPQRGLALTVLPEDGIDIVVALDVSGSMTQLGEPGARAPTKLEAAQEVISEFIESLEGDRVGLVTFQSRAPPALAAHARPRRADAAGRGGGVGLIPDGTAIGLGLARRSICCASRPRAAASSCC